MLARLNAATHSHHGRADAAWLALAATDVRHDDYARQLAVTYGFEAPIESALSYTKGLAGLAQLRKRTGAGLLAQDLLALGYAPGDVTALPQCISIVAFDDIAEALGWLYVVERTAIHHEAVRRNVMQRLPKASHATSYLTASAMMASTRWHALGRVLDEHAASDSASERLLTASEHAYRRLHDWNEMQQGELRSTG